MNKEEKEICSRCHLDMNEAPNKGGCKCCREHSESYLAPVRRVGNPDYLWDSTGENLTSVGVLEEE